MARRTSKGIGAVSLSAARLVLTCAATIASPDGLRIGADLAAVCMADVTTPVAVAADAGDEGQPATIAATLLGHVWTYVLQLLLPAGAPMSAVVTAHEGLLVVAAALVGALPPPAALIDGIPSFRPVAVVPMVTLGGTTPGATSVPRPLVGHPHEEETDEDRQAGHRGRGSGTHGVRAAGEL